jgi:hypothetical protein
MDISSYPAQLRVASTMPQMKRMRNLQMLSAEELKNVTAKYNLAPNAIVY